MNDPINPAHYNTHPSGVECIQITEHMNFCLGNAVKYLWRSGLKSSDPIEDLRKAAWYIEREIDRLLTKKIDDDHRARAAEHVKKLAIEAAMQLKPSYFESTPEEDEAWNAVDFEKPTCPHTTWHYYQSVHQKICTECGRNEAWDGSQSAA